jgi:hypothetical protein
MTLADAIASLPCKERVKTAIRTGLRMFFPGVLEKKLLLKFDREAEKLTVGIEGMPPVELSFEEIETHVASAVV